MKKCPRCGSVNADADLSCGVRGSTLSEIMPLDPSQTSLPLIAAERTSWKTKVEGLVGMSIGVALIGIGLYLMLFFQTFAIGLSSLFFPSPLASIASLLLAVSMIGVGFFVFIPITYDIVTETPNRSWGAERPDGRFFAGYSRNEISLVGEAAISAEAWREGEENRKRVTGEAD